MQRPPQSAQSVPMGQRPTPGVDAVVAKVVGDEHHADGADEARVGAQVERVRETRPPAAIPAGHGTKSGASARCYPGTYHISSRGWSRRVRRPRWLLRTLQRPGRAACYVLLICSWCKQFVPVLALIVVRVRWELGVGSPRMLVTSDSRTGRGRRACSFWQAFGEGPAYGGGS